MNKGNKLADINYDKYEKIMYKGNSWRAWHWLGKELFTVNIQSLWVSLVLVSEASLNSQVFSLLELGSKHHYYVYYFGSDKSLLAFQKYTFAVSLYSLASSKLNHHHVLMEYVYVEYVSCH